jgi:hypothetical protein
MPRPLGVVAGATLFTYSDAEKAFVGGSGSKSCGETPLGLESLARDKSL